MEYRTTDIWMATALFTAGFECNAEVTGILNNGRNLYSFVFEENQKLKDKVYDFENKKLELDVKTLKENFIKLKNLTFE